MLIGIVNLNEKKREKVERLLALNVQTYVEFNSNPSIEAFTEHLIAVYKVSLRSVGSGSVMIIVECPTLEILEHLWNGYLSGELDKVNILSKVKN